MHIGAAGFHADLAQDRQRSIAHPLVFLVSERQGRGNGDRIARMHPHRINILDGTDNDAIIRLVADNLHFIFLPAQHAFFNKNRRCGRGIKAALDDLDEFRLVIGDAATCAAHGEGGADDGGQAHEIERIQGPSQGRDLLGFGCLKADLGHRLAKAVPILGLVDGIGRGPDHLDAIFLKDTHLLQRQGTIQRGLAAHGGEKRENGSRRHIGLFLFDDLGDDLGRDRLDIGGICQFGIGHNRSGIRVDQHDAIPLGLEGFDGLGAGIIKLAGLADDDRPRADDQDGRDICALGHGITWVCAA